MAIVKKCACYNIAVIRLFMKNLARAQRHLSRTMPRPINHEKARIAVVRFLHKLTTRFARENSLVAVEHLNIRGMKKNKKLAKSISDVGWGEFFRQLGYKMPMHGGELRKVPTFFPPSQIIKNTAGVFRRYGYFYFSFCQTNYNNYKKCYH